ncbi:hypothetical protein T492DRAFT_1073151 [Pavlovales sp. CCMP2436]|nr:hypothetical protein T492DRAFT_1073151 [Pavlovales sp. CCMP2436]
MPVMTGELATRALRAADFEGMIVGITGDPLGAWHLRLCRAPDYYKHQRVRGRSPDPKPPNPFHYLCPAPR